MVTAQVGLGLWDDVAIETLPLDEVLVGTTLILRARVAAARGEGAILEEVIALVDQRTASTNVEFAATGAVARAIALRGLGRDAEALEAALPVALGGEEIVNEDRREAYLEAGLSALALGDEATVQRLIDFIAARPPVLRTPLLRTAAARFAGHLAQRSGDIDTAVRRFEEALRAIREIECPYVLGQVLLEYGELLLTSGRGEHADTMLEEATTLFTGLRATPWLQRARALQPEVTV
jgi:tetratricopeptide (TPR) repeat protein